MKILVAGGAGYIGSNVVFQLLEENHKIIVVDNYLGGYTHFNHPNVKEYKVDLRNKDDLFHVFSIETNIDVVMDFAALVSVPESVEKPMEYFDSNFLTTKNILEAMNIFKVKNIVFSSTAAVYGELTKNEIFENDATNPINPYGYSKLAAEFLIRSYAGAKKINYIIFRYFNVAGADNSLRAGLSIHKPYSLIPAINNFIIGISSELNIYGKDYKTKDGTCIRDYIHVLDLANAHVLAVGYLVKNEKSHILNLGSKTGFSVLEVVNEARKTLKIDFEINYHNRRPGDPAFLLANSEKAEKILNWKPKYSLKDMIKSDYDLRKRQNKK